jgi:plasmid stabilization system protein ParE
MPASKPYRFHPQAWQEVEEAEAWYRQRNYEASARFLSEIYDALENLTEWPRRWPSYQHGTRRFVLQPIPVFHHLSGRNRSSKRLGHRTSQTQTRILERSRVVVAEVSSVVPIRKAKAPLVSRGSAKYTARATSSQYLRTRSSSLDPMLKYALTLWRIK